MYSEYTPSTVAAAIEGGRVDNFLEHVYIMDTRRQVQEAVESRWVEMED